MGLPVFAYWSHGCAMYRQQQWIPLADSLEVSVSMAKDVYRKLGAAYGPDMLICTGIKTDGGGGRWSHARPNMGKAKPYEIFDAISADSWNAGELTVSEYSALLRTPRPNPDALTEGPRIPDWSYYLTMQFYAGTDAYRVTVRRDDDEQQGEQPEIGDADTQQQQTPSAENLDTPYWLYQIVPADSPDAKPLEVLAGSFFDFRLPVDCLVTVCDERRETPQNTVLVPAWSQCSKQELALQNLPPYQGQDAISNIQFLNDFTVQDGVIDVNGVPQTVPGDGSKLIAPEIWASHGQVNISFNANLPAYEPDGVQPVGRYLDRVKIGIHLGAGMAESISYGNGEPGNVGYMPLNFPPSQSDPADWELRKSYAGIPFVQPDTAALAVNHPGYADLRNRGTGVPVKNGEPLDFYYLNGKMPIYNGSKSIALAPGATAAAFRVFDGSQVPFLNEYAGIKPWRVSASILLSWDVVDAGGPRECHKRTSWFSRSVVISTESPQGLQDAYTTYPWDVGYFEGAAEEDDDEEEPDPPDPPKTPILEVLTVILLGAIAGLIAALALEAIGAVAIGAAVVAVTEAAAPVAVAAGGALEAEALAIIAEVAATEAELNAAAAVATAGTDAAAAEAALQYAAIRATATAALEQAAQNIARLAGG